MISSPCGRVAASAPALRRELAFGAELMLDSSLRDIEHVRAILRRAIEGLMAEFGDQPMREATVALQLQNLSDQLLASASRRIRKVRSALGHEPEARHETPAAPTDAAGQPAEFFPER